MGAENSSRSLLAPSFSWMQRGRPASVAALFGCMFFLSACNAITGAGELRLKDEEEEEDDGDTTVNQTGGSASASASSGGAVACTYPEGPYGQGEDAIVNSAYKWDGYEPGSSTVSTITIDQYNDCNGKSGINAILFLESAMWCSACQSEAGTLENQVKNNWEAKGIKVVTLMIEDVITVDGGSQTVPATTETAAKWKEQFGLQSVAVLADPGMTFTVPGASSIGLPLSVVVDPRTMKIVKISEGYSGSHPELEALAATNAGAQ